MSKINASDKIMYKKPEKRKYGNKRNVDIKLNVKDCSGMEFIAF